MASYKIVIDTKGKTKKEKQGQLLAATTGQVIDNFSDKDDNKLGTTKNAGPKVVATTMLVGQIKDSISSVGNLAVSTIGLRHDNSALQNKIDNAMNIGSAGISSLTTIGSAAALGGPIGAAVGTAIAAMKIATDAANNLLQYKRDTKLDTVNSIKSSERLGIIATDKNRKR